MISIKSWGRIKQRETGAQAFILPYIGAECGGSKYDWGI